MSMCNGREVLFGEGEVGGREKRGRMEMSNRDRKGMEKRQHMALATELQIVLILCQG